MSQKPKGAIPLKLNNAELRCELIHADTIIKNAIGVMTPQQTQILARMNEINAQTHQPDPFRYQTRNQAMHRITPKRDNAKIALIVLTTCVIFAWYCSYTESELLRAEITQAQSAQAQNKQTQGE